MSFLVSLQDFVPSPRFDGLPWTRARIEEAAGDSTAPSGAFSALGTFDLDPLDDDPSNPQPRSFTVTDATLASGWYRVAFIDAAAEEEDSEPVFSERAPAVYIPIATLRKALSPEGDPTDLGSAASLSDAALYQALVEAAGEVDARLAARYPVPFADPVPVIIAALNRDIAAYIATLTFRRGDPLDARDPVQLRYDRAQAMLVRLESGDAEAVRADGAEQGLPTDVTVINLLEDDQSLFTLDDLGLAPVRSGRPRSYPYGSGSQYGPGTL